MDTIDKYLSMAKPRDESSLQIRKVLPPVPRNDASTKMNKESSSVIAGVATGGRIRSRSKTRSNNGTENRRQVLDSLSRVPMNPMKDSSPSLSAFLQPPALRRCLSFNSSQCEEPSSRQAPRKTFSGSSTSQSATNNSKKLLKKQLQESVLSPMEMLRTSLVPTNDTKPVTPSPSSVANDDLSYREGRTIESTPKNLDSFLTPIKSTKADKLDRNKRSSSNNRPPKISPSKRKGRPVGDFAPGIPRKPPPSPTSEEEEGSPVQSASRWKSDTVIPKEPQVHIPRGSSSSEGSSSTTSSSSSSSTPRRASRGGRPEMRRSRSKKKLPRSQSLADITDAENYTQPKSKSDPKSPPMTPEGSPSNGIKKTASNSKEKRGRRFGLSKLGKTFSFNGRTGVQDSKKKSRKEHNMDIFYPAKKPSTSKCHEDWNESFTERTASTVSTTSTRTLSTISSASTARSELSDSSFSGHEQASPTKSCLKYKIEPIPSVLTSHFANTRIADEVFRVDDEDDSIVSEEGNEQTTSSDPKQNQDIITLKTSSSNKNVGFATVEVREYERWLGDNPSVSSGVPIGLGWAYCCTVEVDVDVYESQMRKPGPRSRKDFFLTPQKRFHLLLDDWQFALSDICRAKNQASEIRLQRQVSAFGETAEPPKMPSNIKIIPLSSKKRMNGKLPRIPKAQDRWDASCPAAPVQALIS